MRNLKKVLSLVLCMAVMLSVMVVGAGAAFKDQEKIKNTEAVDACVALNIINGYTDGSYKPEGTITRAEACKMICVALNGGEEPTLGTSAKASFTDTKGHWAEKYIESCVAQGIVAGIGGGKFNPNGNITGSQFAKMLLTALGFNAGTEGYVGAAWEVEVNVDASAKGLYVDLAGMDPAKALSRDNAAQMVWNALNAYEVEYKYNLVTENGQLVSKLVLQDKVVGSNNDKITLLEDKYEAKAITGTLTSVKQDNGKDTYNITVTDAKYNGNAYNNGKVSYTDVAKDYSNLLYQNVRVLVKPDKNGKDAVVYGVYATNKNTTQSGLLADLKMDGSKVKLDGVKYDLADTTYVYVNGELQKDTTIEKWVNANAEGTKTNEKGSAVKLLATDGTTDYSILQVTTYAIEQVKYVGGDYLTTDSGKKSDDDYNYSSDIKKNDYVVISDAGNYADKKGLIEKADVVDGKIDSTKTNSKDQINKVQIDGTWYTTNVAMTGDSALKLGATVKLVLVNGYIYKTDKVTTAASDIALLVEAGSTSGVGSKYQARLIFTDGSDKVVDIEKTWGDSGKTTDTIKQAIDETPTLVTYDVSKDVYTLTKITTADTAGYDQYVEMTKATVDGSATGTGLTGKLYFESTGVVFVRQDAGSANDDPEFKVVTGKTAANWDLKDSQKNTLTVKAVADTSNSNLYAQVAVVDFGATKTTGSSDKTYAVALDASYTSKEGGTTYTMVKAWNGTKEETFKYEGTKTIAAGTIFEYSDNGDGTVDIDLCKTVWDKVVSYDEGTGDITFSNTTSVLSKSKIDAKDTVVLYVDSDAGEGVGSGEIRQANAYNGGSDEDVANVAIFSEAGEDQITVIVVDVNNDYTAW